MILKPKEIKSVTISIVSLSICYEVVGPWKKNYDKTRQHIKKQRHYFADKVCLVKAMVFPVVMYGCDSLTIMKAECQRIDAFELWCWKRLLRVHLTARRSKQ